LQWLTGRLPSVRFKYHADQNTKALRGFWAATLGVDPSEIRFHPQSNSSERCAHGVVVLAVHDTLLRARLQAWMDRVFASWV
jgi:hypothetical protein